MKIQRSMEIPAPPQTIWPFFVDPEKLMKWFTFLRKFEYTSDRKSGPGTTFYYEEKSGPQLMKFHFKVTEWVPNERFAFVMTSGPMKRDDEVWSIRPTPSGSMVELVMDIEMPGGLIGKAMDNLFVGRGVAKHQAEMLANLRGLVTAK